MDPVQNVKAFEGAKEIDAYMNKVLEGSNNFRVEMLKVDKYNLNLNVASRYMNYVFVKWKEFNMISNPVYKKKAEFDKMIHK